MDFVICKVCGGPFKDQQEFDVHSLTHVKVENGETTKILKCEKCNNFFDNQKLLNIHLWRHLGVFSCKDCDENFMSSNDLEFHEQKTHKQLEAENSKMKKFVCDICRTGFTGKRDLTVHIKLHKNPNLFKCHHCSKRFTTAYNLKKHITLVENPDVYKCSFCPRRFHQQSYLRDHEMTHTNPDGLKCNVCFKTYTRKENLVAHLKLHINPD